MTDVGGDTRVSASAGAAFLDGTDNAPSTSNCESTAALSNKQADESRLGFGLTNTSERPRLLFGDRATLELDLATEGRANIARGDGGNGWRATVTVRDRDGEVLGTREIARNDERCDGCASCSPSSCPS